MSSVSSNVTQLLIPTHPRRTIVLSSRLYILYNKLPRIHLLPFTIIPGTLMRR
jgi:hypothetical protein